MCGMGIHQRYRKEILNVLFGVSIDMFAKENGGFGPVWSLTKGMAEIIKNKLNLRSLNSSGLTTNKQIISKQKRMNRWTVMT